MQSSVVFDDHVTDGDISRYPLVILGNAVCLSQAQAKKLEEYVEQGGALLVCYKARMLDELGYACDRPVIDDLFGIKSRRLISGVLPTFELSDHALRASCGRWVTFRDAMLIVELLADVIACPFSTLSETWEDDWVSSIGSEKNTLPKPAHPGLWLRRVGSGCVAFSSVNLFKSYLQTPTLQALKLISGMLKRMAVPAIELDDPMCITMNCRVQPDGRWAVHLHNSPGTVYRYPNLSTINKWHSTRGALAPSQR